MGTLTAHIVRDAEVCGGEPQIRGTRMTVRTIIESIRLCHAKKPLPQAFPDLMPEDVDAASGIRFQASRSTRAIHSCASSCRRKYHRCSAGMEVFRVGLQPHVRLYLDNEKAFGEVLPDFPFDLPDPRPLSGLRNRPLFTDDNRQRGGSSAPENSRSACGSGHIILAPLRCAVGHG
jgi:uncharacterized protein (DUF433 family)